MTASARAESVTALRHTVLNVASGVGAARPWHERGTASRRRCPSQAAGANISLIDV